MAEEFMVVKDLHKSFNDFKAVNGVSFSIQKGEIFGLLGPNGAGKTTTIRILSTILPPDSGEVTIGGYSLSKDAASIRHIIGVCPQDLALYEDLSAMDNMVFFGRMAGMNSAEAKAPGAGQSQTDGAGRTRQGKSGEVFRRYEAPHQPGDRAHGQSAVPLPR